MVKRWDLRLENQNISRRRFRELAYFCLQYPEWQRELANCSDGLGGGGYGERRRSAGRVSDPTGELAARRLLLLRRCQLVEQAAQQADPGIWQYIIRDVTDDCISYEYLVGVLGIPCGRNYYYKARRRFFVILSEMQDRLVS